MVAAETVTFTAVDYDIDKLPPEAPPGQWTFLIKQALIKATKAEKGAYPMLQLTVVLDEVAEGAPEENSAFIGTELRDWLVFFPEDHKAARTGKRKVQGWVDACNIERSVIPKKIRKPADLQDLVDALEGQRINGWTVQQEDRETGEMRAQMRLIEPRNLNLGGLPPVEAAAEEPEEDAEAEVEEEEEELEEEEENEPPPPATPARRTRAPEPAPVATTGKKKKK